MSTFRLAAIQAAPAAQQNLLRNPDFEGDYVQFAHYRTAIVASQWLPWWKAQGGDDEPRAEADKDEPDDKAHRGPRGGGRDGGGHPPGVRVLALDGGATGSHARGGVRVGDRRLPGGVAALNRGAYPTVDGDPGGASAAPDVQLDDHLVVGDDHQRLEDLVVVQSEGVGGLATEVPVRGACGPAYPSGIPLQA